MVVEDDVQLRRALARVLSVGGHEVLEAGDGSGALQTLVDDPVDLIISDVYMPNMDGIEFLTRIRGALPDVRVIMISGGGILPVKAVLDAASSLGADMTLSKPFTLDEFRAAVARILSAEK